VNRLARRGLAATIGALLLGALAAVLRGRPLGVAPAGPRAPVGESRALALGWGDFATTTLDAAPLNSDHTLSVRFMVAYDASYRGVMIADESGHYHVGMAPYASLGRAALEVSVGGATMTYPLPDAVLTDNDFRAGPPRQAGRRWRQLAISRRGTAVVLFYDGHAAGKFEAGPEPATGKLRLGRLAAPAFGPQDQFYGFIDDVAVWGPGLDDHQLERLTAAARHDELSALPRPRATLGFDAPSEPGSASFTLGGGARLSAVSREHTAALDEPRLPAPGHRTRLDLPFRPGQVWMPIQGVNSALSHHDTAAFAIDFIRVDPRFVTDNPGQLPGGSHAASEGQPVVAPAPGRVAALVDGHDNDETSSRGDGLSNFVCVEHVEGEVSCLLHLLRGAAARPDARVARGDLLAQVGRTGAATVHLHFALSDAPEPKEPNADSKLVTIPAAFSDYFASSDFGRTWHHVERGVPAPGEWVRRAESP